MSDLAQGLRIAGIGFGLVLFTLVVLSVLLWGIGVALRRLRLGETSGGKKEKPAAASPASPASKSAEPK